MTINIANNSPRINYTATANQTVFTVPFEFFDNTDIKVYVEGTLKTITTHYTVSGGNGSTGTVTMGTGVTLNNQVTLVRDVPMERTTDLTSSYNGSSIDAQLDRIVAQIADLDDKASRTIQINDYELASGLLLPALDSRKGKTIQFNTSTGALEVGPTGADLTAIGSVTSEIATLAGISSNITTVAGSNAQVVAVGNAMTSITAINSALTNINTVAGGISNINLVGGSIADVNDVADSLGEISAVQAKLTNIDTVAVASTNIGTVAGSIAQVNSVASKISDVTGVNSNIAAITTANANSTNVNLVANNIDDVNDVGTVITKVTTVADNIASVNTVAPKVTEISTVSTNIGNINTVATNMSSITAASLSAADALASENAAATSATNAANSATASASSATAAAASASSITGAETNAATSATAAATSATAAQTAKTGAETAKSGAESARDQAYTYSQSAASAVAYQDLTAIAESKSDTAVDVFVYDTSKDSDGGAWRKRTQGTSWYNETLNTSTRGSRKEFPAVAVIVAESNQVTIYDGDDPDLPMWMVFETNSSDMLASGILSLTMLNGVLAVGRNTPLHVISFVSDGHTSYSPTSRNSYLGAIGQRNSGLGFSANLGTPYVVANVGNDVAMTVLPNAPVDPATGLPVPTIGIATNGGVSVIKDDGTVVDITYNSPTWAHTAHVAFGKDNQILFCTNSTTSSSLVLSETPIPTADVSFYEWEVDQGYYERPILGRINTSVAVPNFVAGGYIKNFATYNDEITTGSGSGATKVVNGPDNRTNLFNYTTSSYNTGWMNGDIKLATLSDTDDTDVTGSELVTNGTFDSDTSGWTSQYATLSVASGKMRVTNTATNGSGLYYWTAEVGKKYVLTADFDIGTAGGGQLRVWESLDGTIVSTVSIGSSGTYTLTFTATQSSLIIRCMTLGNSGKYSDWDNVSVRLAEEDRSVNGNGLQVFGTVTKNPVATGADLVAYSVFSASNYLQQPYNSDLDFGTGDFTVMGWLKGTDNYFHILDNRNTALTDGWGLQVYNNSGTRMRLILGGATADGIISLADGVWTHFTVTRRGSAVEYYRNGINVATNTNADWSSYSTSKSDTAGMKIGVRGDAGGVAYDGSFSLLRISATAPTAEQIAKIYRDEKPLFQENAKATLYGTSDAVTALAYDDSTDLLHVGTSAGRSVFQGLRRVDNTTTAVGATISASNGLVAED